MYFIKLLKLKILKFFNFLIPKNSNKICLIDSFDNGNGLIFKLWFERIEREKKLVWVGFGYKKKSILYSLFYHFHILTSKFILTTGGIIPFKNKRQIIISLWHGIPIKNIKSLSVYKYIDYHTTTGKFAGDIFINSWGLKKNQLLYLGSPIYNFYDQPELFLTKMELDIINSYLVKDLETVLFAPTYRNSRYSVDDGVEISEIIDQFVDIAKNNNDKNFLISLHPAEFHHKYKSKIQEVNNCDFLLRTSTEKILPFVDIIVVDCSSIYYQALFLKKKVISYFPDFDIYKKNRGFVMPDYFNIVPNEIFSKNIKDVNMLINNYPNKSSLALIEKRKQIFPEKFDSCQNIYSFIKNFD